MIRVRMLVGVAVAALLTGACTTQITTRPDLTMTEPNLAMTGIAYNLPMLQYRIEAAETLSECPRILTFAAGDEMAVFVDPTSLTFDIKVVAKPRYVRGETYVVDYRSLSNVFKQTSFGITTFPGTNNLKSINIAAEDKTGDVLKDVAKIGLTAAAMAGGGPALAGVVGGGVAALDTGGSGPRALTATALKNRNAADYKKLLDIASKTSAVEDFIDCTASAKLNVASRDELADKVKQATKVLGDTTNVVVNTSIAVAARGLPPTVKARYVATLSKALSDQDEAERLLTEQAANKAKADGKLAVVSVHMWPWRLSDRESPLSDPVAERDFAKQLVIVKGRVLKRHEFSVALVSLRDTNGPQFDRLTKRYPVLANYIDSNGAALPAETVQGQLKTCVAGGPDIGRCLAASLLLTARLDTVERNGGQQLGGKLCPNSGIEPFPTLDCRARVEVSTANDVVNARTSTEPSGETKGGVFVRQPVEGRLFICRGPSCDPNTSENLFVLDATAEPTIAPQLGQLRFLPFRNTSFQSNELSLEMAADGTISKFEYKDKAATAAVLSATAADIAKQIDDDRTKRRADAATAEERSVKSLQAQIDTLEKQAKLVELQKMKPADEKAAERVLADLAAETARLNAKLAKQKARNELLAAGGSID